MGSQKRGKKDPKKPRRARGEDPRKKRAKRARRRASARPADAEPEDVAEEIAEHEDGAASARADDATFPKHDLAELLRRMAAAVPENDALVYSTRAEKLSWEDVSFKGYTAAECKLQWLAVQKKVRKFRVLAEVLQSAKEWIEKPWSNFYAGQKNKRHPDMPRRPLSTFMLFYLYKRDKIRAENPDLDVTEISKIVTKMYKALPASKKEKYVKEATEKRKIYEAELEEFHRQHPEVPTTTEKQTASKNSESGPRKPTTPFNLFFESQLKSVDKNLNVEKVREFKEHCKEQWKNMSDKKKVIWINWSHDEEMKYFDELKAYSMQNPDFVAPPKKSVLTKEEKCLKERMAGKPVKPPNSAYSLYSKMMLQSEEIKNISPKDRMVYIAEKWKGCTDEEKKEYNERIVHLREQYKLDFASYLESLPEEKRQEELRNEVTKRKRNSSKLEDGRKRKKSDVLLIEKTSNNKVNKKGKNKKVVKEEEKKERKDTPFSRPPYWDSLKKEEKRTFKNAMMKLKEHLGSRFQKYVTEREFLSSGDEDEEDTSNESEESDSSTEESS